MQHHKPEIDYEQCGVRFSNPVCRGRCLPPDLSRDQTTAPRALVNRVSIASIRKRVAPAPQPAPQPLATEPALETSVADPQPSSAATEPAPEPLATESPSAAEPPITGYRAVPAPVKALVARRAGSKVGITGTAALLIKTKNPALHEPHVRLNGRRVSAGTKRPHARRSRDFDCDLDPSDIRELNAATFNFVCESQQLQP
ncbi:hypothetical protein N0V85_009761, partial [Neurospora sp. IMI 360204]